MNYIAKEFAEMDQFFSYTEEAVMNCRIRSRAKDPDPDSAKKVRISNTAINYR
jgi:hypothetical protein